MPKLKTHKGTAKRIKISPNGKLLRSHANGTHFLAKKSESRKRTIAKKNIISGAIKQGIKRALGA